MDFLIIVAVTADVMFAAMACGASDIRIPWTSSSCIAAVSSGFLILSAAGKSVLSDELPQTQIRWISCFSLMLIGLMQIYGGHISRAIGRTRSRALAPVRTGAAIFLDHTQADKDESKVLSAGEAAVLAVPISIDSLIGGLGVASEGLTLSFLLAAAFVWNFLAVRFGQWIGTRLPMPGEKARTMAGGIALMVLGCCKLIL